jgi:O-antigen/teichoic acid export membrane protein
LPTLTGRRRVLLNSVSATALHTARLASAFIMSPIVVVALGNTIYGFWEVLLALVGYFGILDLGVGPAILRYIAVADGKGDRDEMSRILSTTTVMLAGIGVLAMVLMLGLAARPGLVFRSVAGEIDHVPLAIVLTGLTLLVRFPGAAFDAYYLGRQRHYFLYGFQFLNTVVITASTWYLLTRSEAPPLVVVAGVQAGTTLLYYGVIIAAFFPDAARPRISLRDASVAKVRELLTFGVKSMLLMVSDRLRRSSMPLVITYTAGIDQVVFYALADKVVTYANQMARVFGFPLNAYFSSLVEKDDGDAMLREWLDMSRFLQVVQLGLASVAIILGADFLARWMGPEYAADAGSLIRMLGIGYLIAGMSVNASRILVSLARHERTVMITMPTNILAVALAVVLARIMGLDGIALTLMITSATTSLLVLRESCRALEISMFRYVREAVAPNLPSLATVLVLLATMRHLVPPTGYPELLLDGLVAAVGYIVVAWFSVLRPAERDRARASIREKLASRRAA